MKGLETSPFDMSRWPEPPELQGQTVSLVMGDAPGGVVSGSPPLDWVMCGLAGPSGVEADGTSGMVAK